MIQEPVKWESDKQFVDLVDYGKGVIGAKYRLASFKDELIDATPEIIGDIFANYDPALGNAESYVRGIFIYRVRDYIRKHFIGRQTKDGVRVEGAWKPAAGALSIDAKINDSENVDYFLSECGLTINDSADRKNLTLLVDAKIIEALTNVERMVVESYYFADKTTTDIAKELGVSGSRVCQIKAAAIKKLRLATHNEPLESIQLCEKCGAKTTLINKIKHPLCDDCHPTRKYQYSYKQKALHEQSKKAAALEESNADSISTESESRKDGDSGLRAEQTPQPEVVDAPKDLRSPELHDEPNMGPSSKCLNKITIEIDDDDYQLFRTAFASNKEEAEEKIKSCVTSTMVKNLCRKHIEDMEVLLSRMDFLFSQAAVK